MVGLFGKRKRFVHSGALGDVIYSLPLVRHLGGGILYIKAENPYHTGTNFFNALRRFLLDQDYIVDVRLYPSTGFGQYDLDIVHDYDLDKFRNVPGVMRQYLVKSYFEAFGETLPDTLEPWLKVPEPLKEFEGYAVVNRTMRYRTQFDWKDLHKKIVHNFVNNVVFIGSEIEYLDYIARVGFIRWHPTFDIYEAAQVIAAGKELFCNQSVCLTIAQGLRKIYNLEVANNHENTYNLTPNETLLNRCNDF